jgi:thioesterase domain-containing protein
MNAEERCRATEEFLHHKIPLARAMELRVESCDENELVLTAPITANHNHLGTAFGGSVAALMMLAGYALLWLELHDREAHVVISECRIKFRRPVRRMIRAVCQRPEDAVLRKFAAELAAKTRARIPLQVTISEEGQPAAKFEGIYVAILDETGA